MSNFAVNGYEDLEISTQILIRDAQRRDISVNVLDRHGNFLELKKGDRVEYVKQATKTSRDSYITFLIMENKSVTKQLLAAAGLRVPGGETFEDAEPALSFCETVPWKKFVVKPATTNFGIGIRIFDHRRESEDVDIAISEALSHSDSVIVEEFIEGQEYRFLVVDHETIAVCRRVPANVIGDGKTTIQRLVETKNTDPRRGVGHVTPLERIQLTEIESEILNEDYGLDFESVPAKGETVFLRRNSNISTGGDSIDATDIVAACYKRIAENAAACVDAKICGVDLIVPDPENEGPYAILELNFNPVLYIHNYPYEGMNRNVGEKILDLLGF